MSARWSHQKFGTREDPIHQSDLSDLAGSYGCAKRFAFRKRAEAEGITPELERVSGKMAKGTAVHETLRAYLTGPYAVRILGGELPSGGAVRTVFGRELEKAATDTKTGRVLPIEWYGDDPETEAAECVTMICGVLADMPARASSIVAAEAPFLAQLGDYWLEGTLDLVYRPRENPDAVAFLDWKTGEQRLAQIILDHGYQTGIYAHALEAGVLFPGAPGELAPKQFPSEIFVVHLRDYLPYSRRTAKTIERPEEVEFFGYPKGTKIQVESPGAAAAEDDGNGNGDAKKKRKATRRSTDPLVIRARRGPAWYRAHRTAEDSARLAVSIKDIVSTVRLGRFVEFIDDHCTRCPFKGPCLTDGRVSNEEGRELAQLLKGVDLDMHTKDFAA